MNRSFYALGEDKESGGQALTYLEKAYADRSMVLLFAKNDPKFDILHSDPRYADLWRRMKLAQ